MSENVTKLVDYTNDGSRRDAIDCLEDALENLKTNENLANHKKAVVILVDNDNDNFDIAWFQGGMQMSQCISAIEVAKILFLTEMKYTNYTEEHF